MSRDNALGSHEQRFPDQQIQKGDSKMSDSISNISAASSNFFSRRGEPDGEKSASIGAYSGTMGSGLRITLDPSPKVAPFSITTGKRDVMVQDIEGGALSTSRSVTQLAYEPGIKLAAKSLGGGVQMRPTISFPVGISVASNKSAANQGLEWVPGPIEGTGDYVNVDIPMASQYSGTQLGAFAGVQSSLDFTKDDKYTLSLGVRATAGVGKVKEDVNGVGAFITFGAKF